MDNQINTQAFKPLFLDLNTDSGLEEYHVLSENASVTKLDLYENQVKELVVINNPKIKSNVDEIEDAVKKYLGKIDPLKQGAWVYFSWNNYLIHILEEDDFFKVRTGRNRPLISKEAQLKFRNLKVGIVGLSVGHSIAKALAYSGGCKYLRLADPDSLELSNLNRVQADLTELTINKAVATARQIHQLDPYAEIEIFTDGLHVDNLENFLIGDGKLDLVIDECDDIVLKFYLRFAARSLNMPLLMATDNGFESNIDLLRFDLDPHSGNMKGTPNFDFNEILEALRVSESLHLTPEKELQLITELLGAENISEHMQTGTIERLEHKVASWPQLAMTVFTGGALSAYVVSQLAQEGKIHKKKTTFSFPSLLNADYHEDENVKRRQEQTKEYVKFIDSLSK